MQRLIVVGTFAGAIRANRASEDLGILIVELLSVGAFVVTWLLGGPIPVTVVAVVVACVSSRSGCALLMNPSHPRHARKSHPRSEATAP